VSFFRLHSEFSINRVDGCLHALRDLLHIHVGRSQDGAVIYPNSLFKNEQVMVRP
jgi:hypothetical protein